MATSTPNLVKIPTELWRFSFFQNGGRPPSWILLRVKNDVTVTVHAYNRAKFGDNISNGGRVIAIFRFSRWQPAAILDLVQPTYRTTHDGALSVLSVLSNFVLIWLIVSKILKIQFFLPLAWNCLPTPTFLGGGGYGVLIPWTFSLIETLKRHMLGWRHVV